ncbi:hypothetical protein ABFX02_10G025500 [Erythranthe guttata]
MNLKHNTVSAPPPLGGSATHHHHPYSLHTAFYWGKEAHFLFSGWPDGDSGMYALALILVFALAIIAEFLANLNLVKPGSSRVATISFQTGIHAIRAGFGYMVILAVMSYNGGVFIAAVLGHAVGYVVFGSGLTKKVDKA